MARDIIMDGIMFEYPPKKTILLVTTADGMAGAEKNIYDLTRLMDQPFTS